MPPKHDRRIDSKSANVSNYAVGEEIAWPSILIRAIGLAAHKDALGAPDVIVTQCDRMVCDVVHVERGRYAVTDHVGDGFEVIR